MIKVTATLDGYTQIINGNGQHIKGTISQEVGAIHGFNFDILPKNAGYDLIVSRKTLIKAINTITGRTEFAGRVLLPTPKMDANGLVSKSVVCESYLGYLYDSIQPYKEEELTTLEDFIELVLTNHNEQVEDGKKIYLGTVNVEVADTGNVYKGLQYQTSYETLKTKLVDVYGGELEIEEIDGLLYLNYLKEIGVKRSTKILLGRNQQQAQKEESPLDVITRVIPLGAKLKREVTDAEGNTTEEETEERLTLVGYTPSGGTAFTVPWVDDNEKIAAYGVVCGILELPDVTEQSNLYKKTMEFLTNGNRINLSHSVTALDLKEIGEDIDGFYCGDTYPVENSLIGIDEDLRIVKKTIDINAPYKSSLTFGEKKKTLSQIQANNNNKTEIALGKIQNTIASLNNSITGVSAKVTTFTTNLTQTINSIVSEALATYVTTNDLEQIKEEISSSITQTAEDVTLNFSTEITKVITDINGLISSEFDDLKSYIRYYMNESGQPVIELGASTSDIILKIVNERISFTENGIEIAYISDKQLYITNATILTKLNIGKFSFIPRTNGNLSFVYNGG